jgi:hypothetical protein
LPNRDETRELVGWQAELHEIDGFSPVIIGQPLEARDPLHPDEMITVDSIGIVTVHDGPSLPPGEIIAPSVGTDRTRADYKCGRPDRHNRLRVSRTRPLPWHRPC